MQRIPVTSSELVSVGYDPNSHVLEVEFSGGAVYQYHEVPAAQHEGLMSALSHGRYFNEYVRNAGYSYSRKR